MKMKFTVQERIILESVFPKVQGKLEVVKDAAWFKKDISLSSQEKIEINYKVKDGESLWDKEQELVKGIEVTDNIKPIIVAVLKMMVDKEMITEEVLSLCDKFIPETEK